MSRHEYADLLREARADLAHIRRVHKEGDCPKDSTSPLAIEITTLTNAIAQLVAGDATSITSHYRKFLREIGSADTLRLDNEADQRIWRIALLLPPARRPSRKKATPSRIRKSA